jgi:hypothetical protein
MVEEASYDSLFPMLLRLRMRKLCDTTLLLLRKKSHAEAQFAVYKENIKNQKVQRN